MRTLSWPVLVVLLIFLNRPVLGQSPTMQIYTSKDGTFSFEYPVNWAVENIEGGGSYHPIVENFASDEDLFAPSSIMIQISLPTKFFAFGFVGGQTPQEMTEQLVSMSSIGQPTAVDNATPSADGTPQPLQVMPASDPQIIEFAVNGRPAAYGYSIAQMGEMDASQLIVVVDVGDDYWVTLSSASPRGGLATVKNNEASVLQIAQSLRFTALPPVDSGNPDLPQLYSGSVGIWQRGSIEFSYPADWYVSNVLVVAFSNKQGNLLNVAPVSGQFIASVNGVSETRSAVDQTEVMNNCNTPKTSWTARKLVTQLVNQILPAHLEELTKAGISITQPEVVTINGVEIVYLRQYQGDTETLSIYVDLGGGNIPSMGVSAVRGEMAQFEDQLFEVASTFRYTPKIPDTCLSATPQDDSILIPTPQN
jgi:hypothetical protein